MKKKTGCLIIFLIPIFLFLVFLFWPVQQDESIILSDSFDNNDNNWTLDNQVSIENGELLLSQSEGTIVPVNVQLMNGRIEVTLNNLDSSGNGEFGVIFRDVDDDIYDYFLINTEISFFTRFQGLEDIVSEVNSFINSDSPNELVIEFFGRLIRVYVNETLIAEAYEDEPQSGSVSFYSSGENSVSFDNLEITDFDKKEGNISGTVTLDGKTISGVDVRAFHVVEPETLGVVEIHRITTDSDGSYSFYLPGNSSYFIEAGTPDNSFSGDRYADLQIPDSGLDLNITMKEVK